MTNPAQTGEFLNGLSTALREQLDEVERLAADKGAQNNVTQDVLKEQQESLRIVTEKLGLARFKNGLPLIFGGNYTVFRNVPYSV